MLVVVILWYDVLIYNFGIGGNVVLSRDKREEGGESSIVFFKGFYDVGGGLGSGCYFDLKCFCIKRYV